MSALLLIGRCWWAGDGFLGRRALPVFRTAVLLIRVVVERLRVLLSTPGSGLLCLREWERRGGSNPVLVEGQKTRTMHQPLLPRKIKRVRTARKFQPRSRRDQRMRRMLQRPLLRKQNCKNKVTKLNKSHHGLIVHWKKFIVNTDNFLGIIAKEFGWLRYS